MDTRRPIQIISILITPKTVGDQALINGLTTLANDDPSIRIVRSDSTTGRVLVAGVSETHLQILIDRLRREFNVEATLENPVVFLKTALFESALGESKYTKRVDGAGQYAHVKLQLTPRDQGAGFSFENRLLEGTIPAQFIPAVEQGIERARQIAMGTGHPIDDVAVAFVDGSYHEVDSSESAFRIAASRAFFDGASKARPTIVEPVMRVEATLSVEYAAETVQNLLERGARILGQHTSGDMRRIVALVRVLRIFGLAADLARRTEDVGTYSLQFDHYEPVRDEPSQGGDDRDALVVAPRKPQTPDRMSAIALPEPEEPQDDDRDDDERLRL